ncbi:SDR family NAD(P)-dependent oxidoreductase [Stieleria mannarensis]|uniref:SDR family NAD(P)-dependent oxidoreductase n=1 Tax=Stieleria mannarensis TaxID=2755585 RepID=UPI001C71FD61|nr:SDR family oxidoreductase [Rhodopirellula sp. JC639]
MLPTNGNVLDSMLQGMRQATEANLRLQQDLLRSWTRYWPGFTARPVAPMTDQESGLSNPIAAAALRAVKAQQAIAMERYDTALAAMDAALGIAPETDAETTSPARVVPVNRPASATPPAAEPTNESSNPNENGTSTMITKAPELDLQEAPQLPPSVYKNIREKVAVVTGAASGIGEAVARELANRGAKAVMLVDRSDGVQELAKSINQAAGREVAEAKLGDTTDEAFRKRVFNEAAEKHGIVTICVPAAGITRDALSVTINKETGRAQIYPTETFRQVTEVNLIAPIYWGIEMVARIAEDRRQRGLKRWDPEETVQGVVVFLGSVSSQGNKGQISYAVAKAGLEGAAATLTKEAIFHGVRCGIIHPGFTDTPMARALGQDFLDKNVLPYTQLRRLIKPEEIADAICFMISNSAVSGELWADAGWHGPA